MTKEILINRLKTKATSRKRLLFARYGTMISSFENASIIVDEIHLDLGEEDLVAVSDIYYCRRYFVKKGASKKSNNANEMKNMTQINTSWEDLTWTNPDTIPRATIRSKFAKSD